MEPRAAYDRRDNVRFVDVREPHEWEAGRIGWATHIPLQELPARVDDLQGDEIVVVCRSGGRSELAASFLTQQGVAASNLDGGMEAWAAAGLPVSAADGGPGEVV